MEKERETEIEIEIEIGREIFGDRDPCYTLAITLITLNYRKLGVHEDFHLRTDDSECEMRMRMRSPT